MERPRIGFVIAFVIFITFVGLMFVLPKVLKPPLPYTQRENDENHFLNDVNPKKGNSGEENK